MSLTRFSSLICSDNSNRITTCISNDNNVYSFGYSEYGIHGHLRKQINNPTQIKGLENIIMIACCYEHSLCLDINGNIFSFGKNNCGQLGVEQFIKYTHIPQQITLSPIKQITCGSDFSICLTQYNTVYSFGINRFGQLGLGNNYDYNYKAPQIIPDLNNIDFIVCGGQHVICKTYNNEFYSWGNNIFGQLGQGNNKSCNKPIQCLNWPDNIINIKCGYLYSLILTSEGQVYSFGSNLRGQLGINNDKQSTPNFPRLISNIPEIQRIECGSCHSMCIDINNYLWLFGDSEYGQLGLGDTENKYKPIIHPTLSNIIDISSGGYHTFVKTIDNKIYGFGNNKYSQLGIKTLEDYQLKPIQVFQDNEDIWNSNLIKSKAKSARK